MFSLTSVFLPPRPQFAPKITDDDGPAEVHREGGIEAEAGRRLKVSQPRISDPPRGKISRFSLDGLVNMLTDAGQEVDFRIKPLPQRVA